MPKLHYVEEFSDNAVNDFILNSFIACDDRTGCCQSRVRKGVDRPDLGSPIVLYKSDFVDGVNFLDAKAIANGVKNEALRQQIRNLGGFYCGVTEQSPYVGGRTEGFVVLMWLGKRQSFLSEIVRERTKQCAVNEFVHDATVLITEHGFDKAMLHEIVDSLI